MGKLYTENSGSLFGSYNESEKTLWILVTFNIWLATLSVYMYIAIGYRAIVELYMDYCLQVWMDVFSKHTS